MAKHTAQIRLCKPCEQALRQIAERTQAPGKWHYCEHTGALAVIIIRDQSIIGWSLEGPMPRQTADIIINEGLKDGVLRWETEQSARH